MSENEIVERLNKVGEELEKLYSSSELYAGVFIGIGGATIYNVTHYGGWTTDTIAFLIVTGLAFYAYLMFEKREKKATN